MRKTRKLRVIPPAPGGNASAPVIEAEGPMTLGGGDTDLVCGSCGSLVAKAVETDKVQGIVIRCFRCKALNGVKPGGIALH